MGELKRFDVCLVELDPTQGSEIRKTRPCVIISPDSMNRSRLRTVIIAPMTSKIHEHIPTRIDIEFQDIKGQVVLEQIRTIDRSRVVKFLGQLQKSAQDKVLNILQVMFS